MKVLAALLGPAGIGLMGIFSTMMTMGVSVAGMAIDTTGVRQVAEAAGDQERERVARFGLWTFALPLALVAAVAFWLLSEPLARLIVGSEDHAGWVALVGVGVAFSIVAAAQLAVVQGYRRIGDLAKIRLISAVLTLVVSTAAVYFFGAVGIIVAVLVTPIATSVTATFFRRHIPRQSLRPPPRIGQLKQQWRLLVSLGALITVSAVIGSAGQLLARAVIAQDLGLPEAGLFQASFAISSLNMTLLLGAMVPDFYPRLSAAVGDKQQFGRIVNEQLHVALILGGPILCFLSLGAPVLLQLLYTSEFTQAALLLRVQLIGDAMRILGWALGYAMLAQTAKARYFAVEVVFTAAFVPLLWIWLPRLGLLSAGLAYVGAYSLTLLTAVFLCRHPKLARADRGNLILVLVLVAVLSAIAAASLLSPIAGFVVGVICLTGLVYHSARELGRMGVQLSPDGLRRLLTKQK
jgi:PST family polysaccharide transporter